MKKRYKILGGVAAVLTLGVGAGLASGLHIDEGVVFQPRPHIPRDTLTLRGESGFEQVRHERVNLGGQTLAISTFGADTGPLIVNCFGNAADRRSSGQQYASKIVPHGQALLWDYPGYGDSAGAPSVAAIDAAADALVALAESRAGERELIYWGHSLGGFVCSTLAARSPEADALILETTAPSVGAVAKAWTPTGVPLRVTFDESLSRYDTPDVLSDFEAPILVIGAGKDRVLPVELARDLATELEADGRDVRYLELPNANHFAAGFDPKAQAAVKALLD